MFMCKIAHLEHWYQDDSEKLADFLGISKKLEKNEMKLEAALQSIIVLDSSSTKQ